MSNPTLNYRQAAEVLARSRGCTDQVMLLGLRSPQSKYGQYDDTLALITPDSYTEWKANTLPSKWVAGIAKLEPGDYRYTKGLHGIHHFSEMPTKLASDLRTWLMANIGKDADPIKGYIIPYWAFRQSGPVTLIRDGAAAPETETDPGKYPFIDLHCGGWNGTSSAGCQTWHPERWKEARAAAYAAMDRYSQKTITYGLHQL